MDGNRRGIAAMCLAVASFAATDGLMKIATESLPVSQVIAIRGMLALAIISTTAIASGALADFRRLAHPLVLVRAFFEITMITSYVTALSRLPLAIVFSILQAAPIVITAFSALAWGEKVGRLRWFAIAGGFAGVLLITRPGGEAFNATMALAIIASLCVAGRDLTTSRIPQSIPSVLVTLSATISSSCAGLLLSTVEGWRPMGLSQALILLAAAVTLAAGNFSVVIAYRNASISAVAPFRYMGVAFAILFGWLIWGFVPDAMAMLGIAIVVACGILALRRPKPAQS